MLHAGKSPDLARTPSDFDPRDRAFPSTLDVPERNPYRDPRSADEQLRDLAYLLASASADESGCIRVNQAGVIELLHKFRAALKEEETDD